MGLLFVAHTTRKGKGKGMWVDRQGSEYTNKTPRNILNGERARVPPGRIFYPAL